MSICWTSTTKIREKITKYEYIIKDQDFCDTWLESIYKEMGGLAKGYGTFKSANTIELTDRQSKTSTQSE